MKTSRLLLPGALALSVAVSAFTAQAGTTTTYTSQDKGVTPTQPLPPLDPISYNNIELLYAYTDIDGNLGGNDHTNGGKLNIEYSPFKNFYLSVGAEYAAYDDADLWLVHGGIGGYIPLTPNIHLAADGGILWTDVEYDNDFNLGDDSNSDTGWYVRPHLRGKWGKFETHLGAIYRDLGDFNDAGKDGRWGAFAQLYFQVAPTLDLTAGVLAEDDLTQVTGGIRWRF